MGKSMTMNRGQEQILVWHSYAIGTEIKHFNWFK